LKVPQDAGVIGFDDSVLAIRRNLKLSTMRMPVRQMGAAAVKMVISRLTEDSVRSAPSKLILRAELIVRQGVLRADKNDKNSGREIVFQYFF
jgi:DNA-binding LacI/PurR family transcriptional regulator